MHSEIEKNLEEIFANRFNLRGANWSLISNSVKVISCKKNKTIRQPEKKEQNLYILLKGATGSLLHKKDKLVCMDICFGKDFFGDYHSLITNEKSPLEIRALTDCTYMVVPFINLLIVYKTISENEIEKIERTSAEYLYILKHQELIELKTLTAKERYLKLLENQPEIIQQIPLRYIASYLSITAESMSRIRRSVTGH